MAAVALYSGKWVTDGSPGLKADGATVKSTEKASQSTRFNCLWQDSHVPAKGEHYWEVTVVDAPGVNVGVTSAACLKSGWGTRGYFFGGNLSSGSALIKSGWGPAPGKGDVVGVALAFKDDGGFTVDYYLNGRHLGRAFDVSKADADKLGHPLFPAVQFNNGPQSVSIARAKRPAPGDEPPAPAAQADVGSWQLSRYFENGQEVQNIQGKLTTAPADGAQGRALRLVVKCGNTISTTAEQQGQAWRASLVMSTKMYCAATAASERAVSNLLSNLNRIAVLPSGELEISGGAYRALFTRE